MFINKKSKGKKSRDTVPLKLASEHFSVTMPTTGHNDCYTVTLARVNETVSGDWTALMWAAWYGELAIVKLLLQVPSIQVEQKICRASREI
jgi:hypothetical protein